MANLTKAQARLVREIGEIENELRLDHRALAERQAPDDDLTTLLVLLRKRLVSAEIVHEYTFLDELLAMIAADYFFRTPPRRQERLANEAVPEVRLLHPGAALGA